jgi:hypothetical protein
MRARVLERAELTTDIEESDLLTLNLDELVPDRARARLSSPSSQIQPWILSSSSMRFPQAVRFDICLYASSASTVGTGNGKNSWIFKCHKKWNLVFKMALLISSTALRGALSSS